ncbi:MAG: phosphatidyl-myo-inositol alpha-mannosyltransferase [Solirubrobacteraceae bacterium]|jgi:phosphatidylinositol alpha-mannosyltransferase|nr:phosphatidyl-myo-inositol alpha-mannosyltransferase [Solirubrobacteraceae bacterium]
MRIALVSPYSWTYPGGVTRHIEALASQFFASGHEVRVLAPYDPPDRLSARLHRGARPEPRELPDWVIPLGRTIGFKANGAVSNLSMTPYAVTTLRRELRAGGFDVIHLHEPHAPVVGYDALDLTVAPLVGTFHCYSDNAISNGVGNVVGGAKRKLNRLHVRIAVSEAAAWTGRRFFGGHYRVIPNGVDVPAHRPEFDEREPGAPLRLAFVGQTVERKGLPVLLRAYEALREHLAVELVLVGAERDEVEPLLLDGGRGVTVLGKVSDAEKIAAIASADLLVAPSLGGESFGMVLTEAFAAGTPVVASDIPGYRDVVRDGVDGVLVPRADATALAETLRDLALDPVARRAMAAAARERAQRFAWPTVAAEVLDAYRDATAMPAPATALQRAGIFLGALPAHLGPREPAARRLPSPEPAALEGRSRVRAFARKAGLAVAGIAGTVLALLALQRIGLDRIGASLLAATPWWVVVGLGLMCASMALRGVAWHAILQAAMPDIRVRRSDALQGTFIGVLMSATLPARLGEPSRALIVARRTGRPREHLPIVVGSIVSQALLNVLALVILGIVMFSTVDFFSASHRALLAFALAPMVMLVAVLAAPALLRGGVPSRSRRVQAWVRKVRAALAQVRAGLRVFRQPRLGLQAVTLQLLAWGIQWLSCYVLLAALGLDDRAGVGAAAAVLFAVNVTAVLPATPSNFGVFQAACVAVLHGAYGVGSADALAYGIILQAIEIATAVLMGAPALLKEGLSWRDVRLRALHASPVRLDPLPASRRGAGRARAEA